LHSTDGAGRRAELVVRVDVDRRGEVAAPGRFEAREHLRG
jgi:hypothetical protein